MHEWHILAIHSLHHTLHTFLTSFHFFFDDLIIETSFIHHYSYCSDHSLIVISTTTIQSNPVREESYRRVHVDQIRGMRKFTQSETAWELESGYQSLDQLHIRQEKEEEEGTKLDLLDSLILQDAKERLLEVTEVAFPGQVQSVQSVSLPHSSAFCLVEYINICLVQVSQEVFHPSEVQIVNSFMEQDIPLVFPGQFHLHSSQVSLLQLSLARFKS